FMDLHPTAGAATCKIELPSGGIDEASHRGFPTPWNAFTHFSGLEKLFPKIRLFAGYTQGFGDFSKIHEVDAISGAFLFVRRDVGEKIGWWDEEYFFYGEDIQFCYDIKKLGYKIYYVPDVSILHYGGVSSGIKKQSQDITTADKDHKKVMQGHRFEAMRIFYKKNYSKKYPSYLNWVVAQGIDFLHKKNTS
ncbi:MAG: glycosyltransferase, partial [Bacteroidota bacterium]|nr:glycosyltransferase [Bacteroidota bacterium]